MTTVYVKFQFDAFEVSKSQALKSNVIDVIYKSNSILEYMLTLSMQVQPTCPKINMCLRIVQYQRLSRVLC